MLAGARRQRLNARSDIRPFTSMSGTPRAAAWVMRFGQSSDSTNSARSGRQ